MLKGLKLIIITFIVIIIIILFIIIIILIIADHYGRYIDRLSQVYRKLLEKVNL